MNAYTRQGDRASAQTMQLKLQEVWRRRRRVGGDVDVPRSDTDGHA
jgi:hypothetical protein